MSEKPALPNVCSRCGKRTEGEDRWTWKHTDDPCATVDACFAHLRERVEDVERRLESHNL